MQPSVGFVMFLLVASFMQTFNKKGQVDQNVQFEEKGVTRSVNKVSLVFQEINRIKKI